MQGQYRLIAERPTYFPPFINEVFGKTPYWACTFASLLNGANIAWRGEKPATVDEIKALARASGDVHLKGGSQSSHMVTAIKVRYGEDVAIQHLPADRVATRLAHGWAMVAAVTYGDLPKVHRRHSPYFKGGHRVVLIGWDNGRTKILDPMATRDSGYTGDWIQWSEFEPAWWSREQLWFREGMFLPQRTYLPAVPLDTPRRWKVAAGTTLKLMSPKRAGVVVRQLKTGSTSSASFDALVGVLPPGRLRGHGRPLIRISSGPFAGLLVDPSDDGIDADLIDAPSINNGQAGGDGVDAAVKAKGGDGSKASAKANGGTADAGGASKAGGPSKAGGASKAGKVPTGQAFSKDPIIRARQEEWDRIHQELGSVVNLPARP